MLKNGLYTVETKTKLWIPKKAKKTRKKWAKETGVFFIEEIGKDIKPDEILAIPCFNPENCPIDI